MFARSPKKHTRQKSFSVQQLAPRSFYEAVAICETDDVAIVRELLHSNNRNVAPYCVFYACFGAPHPVKTLNMLFNSGCNMETPIPKLPKEGPFSAEVRSLVSVFGNTECAGTHLCFSTLILAPVKHLPDGD